MVRCAKCGTENKEDASYCVQCGASLQPSRARGGKFEKYEKQEKTERDVCFGVGYSARHFWLVIGLLIVLWGAVQLLEILFQVSFNIWPLILVVLGLYIIYRVLSRPRRPSPP